MRCSFRRPGQIGSTSASELMTGLSVTFWLLERWASNLATSFQPREQQIEIEHPALGPESV